MFFLSVGHELYNLSVHFLLYTWAKRSWEIIIKLGVLELYTLYHKKTGLSLIIVHFQNSNSSKPVIMSKWVQVKSPEWKELERDFRFHISFHPHTLVIGLLRCACLIKPKEFEMSKVCTDLITGTTVALQQLKNLRVWRETPAHTLLKIWLVQHLCFYLLWNIFIS